MKTRLHWIDQARGLSIFAVVYGHNFPVWEPYIYSFHVPLFFFIAGMFHPQTVDRSTVVKRAKSILLPYFLWAAALFLFWLVVGRNLGSSADLNLSVWKNLVGVFYAQGGQTYMDWGIPLWFLPCVFVVFILAALIQKWTSVVGQYLLTGLLIALGFTWAYYSGLHLPWSIDVAMVALFFYFVGGKFKSLFIQWNKMTSLLVLLLAMAIHVGAFYLNSGKVDMYRSIYGDPLWFLISGLFGSIGYILLFKVLPIGGFLTYIGKHTIVILATHLRLLSGIKLALIGILGITVFDFSESQKVLLSILQIILAIPIIWAVNKYAPILDGKIKKA